MRSAAAGRSASSTSGRSASCGRRQHLVELRAARSSAHAGGSRSRVGRGSPGPTACGPPVRRAAGATRSASGSAARHAARAPPTRCRGGPARSGGRRTTRSRPPGTASRKRPQLRQRAASTRSSGSSDGDQVFEIDAHGTSRTLPVSSATDVRATGAGFPERPGRPGWGGFAAHGPHRGQEQRRGHDVGVEPSHARGPATGDRAGMRTSPHWPSGQASVTRPPAIQAVPVSNGGAWKVARREGDRQHTDHAGDRALEPARTTPRRPTKLPASYSDTASIRNRPAHRSDADHQHHRPGGHRGQHRRDDGGHGRPAVAPTQHAQADGTQGHQLRA